MNSRISTSAVVFTCVISLVNAFIIPHHEMTKTKNTPREGSSGFNNLIIATPPHLLTMQLSSVNNSDDTTTLKQQSDDEQLTSVGSTEYYQGFLTRPPNEEPIERVTGDAILGPTLKFAGGISIGLVALVLVFLVSNGLL